MNQADRRAILEMSDRLRHQARGLRGHAVATIATTRGLIDRLACRSRSTAFSCPFLIRGGSEELPERGQAAAGLICHVCGREIRPGQSAVSLQTTPSHVDCAHPMPLMPARGDAVVKVDIVGVFGKNGRTIVAWDHCCGRCGSSWRRLLIWPRCLVCAGRL